MTAPVVAAVATFREGARRECVVASVTVPVTATTYAAGQCLGGLLSLPNLGHLPADELILMQAELLDAAKQNAAADLVLFDQQPGDASSALADAATATIDAADLGKVTDVISFLAATYANMSAATSAASFRNLRSPIIAAAQGTGLFAALITRGTPTYTASCLTLKLTFSRRPI